MSDLNHTKSVLERCLQAGSRTYYFDIKQTKANDYFLIISERRKSSNGKLLKKQRLFLYKEHFDGFVEVLQEIISYIIAEKGTKVLH